MKAFTWSSPVKNIFRNGNAIMIVEDDGNDSGANLALLPINTTNEQLQDIAKILNITELTLLHK